MKHKKLIWAGFIVMILVQLYMPAYVIIEREKIIEQGKMWKFKTQPVDPNDVFRGKYIYLNFTNSELIASNFNEVELGNAYVKLIEDANGYAIPSIILNELPPNSNDYLQVKVTLNPFHLDDTEKENSKVYFEYPFDRFYLEESKAPAAELTYARATRDTLVSTCAVVYVHNGKSVLNDVLIDGISVNDSASD
jgi:uncharacterized membrane-anchored protein